MALLKFKNIIEHLHYHLRQIVVVNKVLDAQDDLNQS